MRRPDHRAIRRFRRGRSKTAPDAAVAVVPTPEANRTVTPEPEQPPSAELAPAEEPQRRRPIPAGTKVLIGALTGVVAFLAVTQAQQRETDALAGMRQADLVRLIDELGTRIDTLTEERDTLRGEIVDLQNGVTSQEAAVAAAEELSRTREIHAGVVPVRGSGVTVTVTDPEDKVSAQSLVTLIEELRNSGAEAIEVDGVRFGTNGWIIDGRSGIEVNGDTISSPYTVRAIGDPDAISVALEMPGGVLALLRANGATTNLQTESSMDITSVTTLPTLLYAEVVEPEF